MQKTNAFSTNQPRTRQQSVPQIRFNQSSSIGSLLCGQPTQCTHYIDALERFKKDFAATEKVDREQRMKKKQKEREYRMAGMAHRQYRFKMMDEQIINRVAQKQAYSQHLYDLGVKKSGLSHGIPINPISNHPLPCPSGHLLLQNQSQDHINKMVRVHHLQKFGTSGYNIINGKQNLHVFEMVKEREKPQLGFKIEKYEEKLKLKPQARTRPSLRL